MEEPNLRSLIHLHITILNFLSRGTIVFDFTVCAMGFEFFTTLTVEITPLCNNRGVW
jgi:hypothetical protein